MRELGVGVVFLPGLEALIEAGQSLIDVLEIEPQPYWLVDGLTYRVEPGRLAELCARPQVKLLHGVGLPVGGACPGDVAQLQAFAAMTSALAPPWASEHLSFRRVKTENGSEDVGFLLPPVQSPEAVALAAANLRGLRELLGVPVAFETGVNYLRPQPGELRDGAYWRAVAEAADAGILLDLHNLWCNARNGRQSLDSVLAELPLERVWEVHLAGGQSLDGYWLDAHSGLTPPELMALARDILPTLPNLGALIFELIPEYAGRAGLSVRDYCQHLEQLHRLWDARGKPVSRRFRPEPGGLSVPHSLPSPSDWETALAGLVRGRAADSSLSRRLEADPGVAIFQRLVRQVRFGTLAQVLTLCFRYLVLTRGLEGFESLAMAFGRERPPQAFPLDEARDFAAWLARAGVELAPAAELAAFELTCLDALSRGVSGRVRFSFEPQPVLEALGAGRIPPALVAGAYELEVVP